MHCPSGLYPSTQLQLPLLQPTPAMPLAACIRFHTLCTQPQAKAPGSSPPDLSYTSLTAASVPASPLPPPAAAAASRTTTPSAPYTRPRRTATRHDSGASGSTSCPKRNLIAGFFSIGTATTPLPHPVTDSTAPPAFTSGSCRPYSAMDVDTNASSTSPAHDAFPHQPVDDDTKAYAYSTPCYPFPLSQTLLPSHYHIGRKTVFTHLLRWIICAPPITGPNSELSIRTTLKNYTTTFLLHLSPVAESRQPQFCIPPNNSPRGTLLLPSLILSLTLLTPLWTSPLL